MEPAPQRAQPDGGRAFLGVQFLVCGVYGRLYMNPQGNAYLGRCPRCGAPLRVCVGDNGTSLRFFQAICSS